MMPRRARWPVHGVAGLALLGSLLALPAATDARSWSAGPRLAVGRQLHTATPLTGTRILVAGGLRSRGPTGSSEIFDERVRRWTRAGSLGTPRLAHAAAGLFGGKVLAVGGGTLSLGSEPSYLASAEIYDPATNRWTRSASAATARANHTATLLRDGRVLVAGGLNSFGPGLASAEIYSPATNRWASAGRMRDARFHHTATLLPDGRVLIAGGHSLTGGGSTVALAGAELYDPASNSWAPAPRMSVARDNHTATLMPGGRVLVAGGGSRTRGFVRSSEVYDPSSNRWSSAGRMREPRGFHAMTLLPDRRVLALGGFNDCGALSGAELYSPATGRWSRTRSLRRPRAHASATAFPSGQVLVAGGSTFDGLILRSGELLNPGRSDRTGPQLCRLTMRPQRLRAARSGPSTGRGATVRYRVNERGSVRFGVRRLVPGRVGGGRCRAARGRVPRNLRCVRSLRVRGSFRVRSRTGRNRFRFSGRLGGRTLSPGNYRLLARPFDRRRNAGETVDVTIRIRR